MITVAKFATIGIEVMNDLYCSCTSLVQDWLL